MSASQKEPVMLGTLPGAVTSVIFGGLAAFNVWVPTDDQVAWINTALIPALILLGGYFIGRRIAWSPASVDAAVITAVADTAVATRAEVEAEVVALGEAAKPDTPEPEPVGLDAEEQLAAILRQIQIAPPPAPAPPVLTPPPVARPLGLLDPTRVGGRDPQSEGNT